MYTNSLHAHRSADLAGERFREKQKKWEAKEQSKSADRRKRAVEETLGKYEEQTSLLLSMGYGAAAVATAMASCDGDATQVDPKDGRTALHQAAMNGHADTIAPLVAAGAAINAVAKDGRTALHWAASMGRKAVVEELLRAGSDPSLPTVQGKTALQLAMAQAKTQNGTSENAATAALLRAVAEVMQANPSTPAPASVDRVNGLADTALKAGTRLHVEPYGYGTYERFEHSVFYSNDHYIRFDDNGLKKVELKKLAPSKWMVLHHRMARPVVATTTTTTTTSKGVPQAALHNAKPEPEPELEPEPEPDPNLEVEPAICPIANDGVAGLLLVQSEGQAIDEGVPPIDATEALAPADAAQANGVEQTVSVVESAANDSESTRAS